jgi:hypothetical protein
MRRALVVVGTALIPTFALAQDPPAPPVREGLFGGVGLYGGNISCNGSACGNFSKGGGGAGFIGWMFSPQLGVLVDGWAMTAKDSSGNSDVTLSFISGTIDVRYYLAPAFWIQGGLGNGHAEVHVGAFAARGDDVPVGLIAAGLELVRGRSWALDVAFKLAQGTSTKSDSASGDATTGRMVGLGANITFFSSR